LVQKDQFIASLQPGAYIGKTSGAYFKTGIGLQQGELFGMLNFVAVNRLKLHTSFGVSLGYKF